MKNRLSVFINIISIIIILLFLFVPIIPVKSIYFKQIIIYIIWFLIIFINVKYLNKDKLKDFGFTTKVKIPKKVKRNARLIGLLLGIISNVIIFYTIDFSAYLKGLNIIEMITISIIFAPITEEIVFRGFIQTVLGITFAKYKRHKIFWLPIIITSIIFGLLHFTAIKRVNIQQTIAVVVMAVVLGLLSGYFKEKYKSLVPSVNMHIATNFGASIALAFLLIISPANVRHKIIKRINKPEYNFDMNDSTEFYNSLINFSIYEKELELPDSMYGKVENIQVTTFLTIDSAGKITNVQYDTIRNWNNNNKIENIEFYKNNALEVARKLPQFIPLKNLKKDTTIVFYVSY